MRYNYQDGMQIGLFGVGHVPVNRFRAPGKDSEKKTNGICGLSSLASSRSYDLQRSLESKLRQRMDVNGSPEYEMTWKRWDMQSGPPICRLAVSQRRTNGIGCSGWQTPKTPTGGACPRNTPGGGLRKLEDQAELLITGWPTASSRDWKDTGTNTNYQRGIDRKILGCMVQTVSGLIQSQSPAQTENGEGCLAGWPTPESQFDAGTRNGHFYENREKRGKQIGLSGTVKIKIQPNTNMKLNPLFSLWLMGYPAEWAYCVVPEMR